MHPNTFGGLEPPGPAGGAYVLPRPPIAAMGDLLGEGGKGRGPTLKRDERRKERRKGVERREREFPQSQGEYNKHYVPTHGWRRGVVVSGVRRKNQVNARRARLLPGWVTVFGRVCHLGV